MNYTIKKQKIWIALILVTVSALAGAMLALSPSLVTAQEPEESKPGTSEGFTVEALAPFQVYSRTLGLEKAPPFDLEVVKRTKTPAVTSGNFATFVITITNKSGTNSATGVLFYDDYPQQMSQVSYQFSVGNVVSNGVSKPTWLFLNPINPGGRVVVTVTGRLNSVPSVNVTNVAEAFPYTAGGDPSLANNQSSAAVVLTGSNPGAVVGPIYLPFIFKFPQPTLFLAYSEDFDDSGAWDEFESDGCTTENEDGRYRVDVEANESCLPAADNDDRRPERPFRRFGEFEVDVYRSEGDEDFSYGIFINGRGGDNFYLLRVWPNNDSCSSGERWRLVRREDGDDQTLASGCSTAIRSGSSVNRLRLAHTRTDQLIAYANGIQLNTTPYTDNDALDGEATGVYADAEEDDIVIKFDNFKVYRYP